ncbi:MAG: hypothetical protein Q8N36_00035 [bacterium]|nr:hypothetical protein [bacterium]
MNSLLESFLKSLSRDEGFGKDNLLLVPIYRHAEYAARHYLLLGEAREERCFKISEVNEQGSVNTLLVENKCEKDVLILDGEELIGSKQNRMVNATILVPGKSTLNIPVSCVERGRWGYNSSDFKPSDAFGYSELRRQKTSQVSASLSFNQTFSSNQGEVWDEIDRKHRSVGSKSDTDAMHEVYQHLKVELGEFVKGMSPKENQIGIAVFINGYFNCMDVFSHPEVLVRMWNKLLTSYAMEAVELGKHGKKRETPESIDAIMEELLKSETSEFSSVGQGVALRIKGKDLVGAALMADENFLHMALFQSQDDAPGEETYTRPSRRRDSMDHYGV